MVDLKLIRKLRESTGCGMMKCKEALEACNNDYETAIDWLRKKGLSTAAKKSGRSTTEGLIGIINKGNVATIVEVNSETDFVAKNDKFQKLVEDIAEAGLQLKNSENFVENAKNVSVNGVKIDDEITNKIAVIGENLQLRRGKTVELNGNGTIISYLHNAVSDKLGKIGVLVVLNSEASKDRLEILGKQIAMHIAASKPEFLCKECVPVERLQRERDICSEQARNSGKPENIIEKMIDGRIRKFYEEICLLEQAFVMDDKIKVADVLKNFERENNTSVKIQEYVLFILGDGLEKAENDFAAEVASMTK